MIGADAIIKCLEAEGVSTVSVSYTHLRAHET